MSPRSSMASQFTTFLATVHISLYFKARHSDWTSCDDKEGDEESFNYAHRVTKLISGKVSPISI